MFTSLSEHFHACCCTADLFTALDSYLRKERVRFTELFRYYDKDSE
jgi:hypothetical protein